MKTFFVICVLAAAVASVRAGDGDILDKYDGKAILNDEAQWKDIYACMMGEVPCGDKQDLRDQGAKVIATNCGDCTPVQKEKYDELMKLLFEKYPKEYNQLFARFSKQKLENPEKPETPETPEKLEKPENPERPEKPE